MQKKNEIIKRNQYGKYFQISVTYIKMRCEWTY